MGPAVRDILSNLAKLRQFLGFPFWVFAGPFLQLLRASEESFVSALTPAWAPIHPAAAALVLLRIRYWASQSLQTQILFLILS